MVPSQGRTVLYTLTETDAAQVNRRRTTGTTISERMKATPPAWPSGAQAHIGNEVKAGDVFPMVMVRTWSVDDGGACNGQVFLDGNDTLWVTSVEQAPHGRNGVPDEVSPGKWHVPPRV